MTQLQTGCFISGEAVDKVMGRVEYGKKKNMTATRSLYGISLEFLCLICALQEPYIYCYYDKTFCFVATNKFIGIHVPVKVPSAEAIEREELKVNT